jgi:hypothetical protein
MSVFKTTLASASYIVTPNSAGSTLNYTPAVSSVIADGRMVPGDRVTKPGVFTQGTPSEATQLQYSSNA